MKPLDYMAMSEMDHNWTHSRQLLHLVARAAGTSLTALRSRSQLRRIAQARQVAMWLIRNLTNLSYPEIGTTLGGRDHSTAQHACNAVDEDIRTDGPRAALLVMVITRAAGG